MYGFIIRRSKLETGSKFSRKPMAKLFAFSLWDKTYLLVFHKKGTLFVPFVTQSNGDQFA